MQVITGEQKKKWFLVKGPFIYYRSGPRGDGSKIAGCTEIIEGTEGGYENPRTLRGGL